ncbi:MAG: flagellin FliC [Limnohabitans sp.]|jgi:flagellin|uniref:flagellin N-terminal helical domain-containing protein n=1 Tax=Limnohabitans sp. TaxID=1907725 RepID=UPI0025E6A3D4|nr:flagellin [Limnohabitans sp.]MCO4088174.1 flagellin FliC [Limnohabitans sp.]
MSVINTNVKSLVAQNAMTINNRSMNKAMEQLSTGSRINSAADDATGLGIANKMTAQIRGLNQAVRNANDGISMIQTAEGATKEITNMLQRMRELAVQSANGTYNDADDRASLDAEFTELVSQISDIAANTKWNNTAVIDSSVSSTDFQVGANSSETMTWTMSKLDTTTLGVASSKVDDVTSATAALTALDSAIGLVDTARSTMGAMVNRLTYAADNLANISQNTSASRSRIQDTDYATATTELARTQIIAQAATAMLAQANQQPQMVLKLLG